jgi:hypothetical protein
MRPEGTPPHPVLARRGDECERARALRVENRELRARSSLLLQELINFARTQQDRANRLKTSIQNMDEIGLAADGDGGWAPHDSRTPSPS